MVIVKVLFFAKARELSGLKEDNLTLPQSIDYNSLIELLASKFNLQAIKGNFIIALNEEYIPVGENVILKDGNILAIIPPLSGGLLLKKMNIIEIVKDKIKVEELIDKVKSPNCGAVSVFIGTTRNTFQDLEVVTLYYEAYESMAVKAIEVICTKIRNNWPMIENIAVSHRLGEVGVTETSVVIAISSPHRAESIAAVNFGIEELKSTVPIWKKEIYKDNVRGKWKENKECAWHINEELDSVKSGVHAAGLHES